MCSRSERGGALTGARLSRHGFARPAETKMKKLLFASLAAAAFAAQAGEDSTDKSGIGGTGLAFYDSPCGHQRFVGPAYPEDQLSCKRDATAAETSGMGPMMEQHRKMADEMSGMPEQHRAMRGGTGGMHGQEAGD